jgi:hypothetical protein
MTTPDDRTFKAEPAAAPVVPEALAAKVALALEAPEQGRDLRVRLDVEGGLHEERYELRFDASGAGDSSAALRSVLAGKEVAPATGKLPARSRTQLLRALDVPQLARAAAAPPWIPPDSLIGTLEITDGEQRVNVVFMADTEQARTAGFELPPPLQKAVDTIYSLAARQLGERDVRP